MMNNSMAVSSRGGELFWSPVGPFEACADVRTRWPNIKGGGLMLQRAIWRTYVQPTRGGAVSWFDDENQRAITRHPLNMRQVGTHLSDMVEKIRIRGTQVQYRGRPVLVATTHPQHFLAAGAGTFCDSFYEALRLYPSVPNVQMSLEI